MTQKEFSEHSVCLKYFWRSITTGHCKYWGRQISIFHILGYILDDLDRIAVKVVIVDVLYIVCFGVFWSITVYNTQANLMVLHSLLQIVRSHLS